MGRNVDKIGLWGVVITGVALGVGFLLGLLLESAIVGSVAGLGAFTLGVLIVWLSLAARGSDVAPEPSTKKGRGMAIGMAIGLPLGVALGAALGNFAFIGVGVAIGTALGAAFEMNG